MAINIENPNEFVNKEIMKRNLLWHHNLPLDDISKAMDEARGEGYKQGQKVGQQRERLRVIDAIWTWWNTRPQHLFATPLDIEELVNIIKKVD